MPQTGSSATGRNLLDDQQRLRSDLQDLAGDGADERLAERAHAAAAHADQVGAGAVGALGDGLGDRPDQDAGLAFDAGGGELLFRRGEPALALILVVLRELRLSD